MKPYKILLLISLTGSLLYGCAAAVVGGAATGASAVHDRRTVGTFIDDEGIELKARLAIFNDKELNSQIHINIVSINGVVLLVGQAPTEAMRQKAAEIVSTVPKVRLIHNEMSVAAPNSYLTRSSDSLITAKVKAKMFSIDGQENFDPTRVKIVTENGIVYLMGILSHSEADTVTDAARQVGGVQKIVKLFEYTD
jgi:osmotically-inducible protein OsmY